MIRINYGKMKKYCLDRYGIKTLEAEYLGDGVLGRFFPPGVILICPVECEKDSCYGKQREVLVFLHEMCHYFKYLEHIGNYGKKDEEACFEFEVICNEVLNNGNDGKDFETVKRLGLERSMEFLEEVKRYCREREVL